MSFQELMATGGADEKHQIQALQGELQSDDPINIQFTSVRKTVESHGAVRNQEAFALVSVIG